MPEVEIISKTFQWLWGKKKKNFNQIRFMEISQKSLWKRRSDEVVWVWDSEAWFENSMKTPWPSFWPIRKCGGLNSGSMQHADRQAVKQKGLTYCWTSPNTSAQVSPQLQERRQEPPKTASKHHRHTKRTNTDRDRDFLSNRSPSGGGAALISGKKLWLHMALQTLK